MARTRDEDSDDEDERPRRRRREEDQDDEDERPRRRSRDEDEDEEEEDERPRGRRSSSENLGPLDKMFRDTNIVVLVLFGCCCGIIALIMSLICLCTAKDEKARSNSIVVLVISGIMTILGVVAQVMQEVVKGH